MKKFFNPANRERVVEVAVMLAKLAARPSLIIDALPHLIVDFETSKAGKDFEDSITLAQVLNLNDKIQKVSQAFTFLVQSPGVSFNTAADAAENHFRSPLLTTTETGVISRTIQFWGATFVSQGCKFKVSADQQVREKHAATNNKILPRPIHVPPSAPHPVPPSSS